MIETVFHSDDVPPADRLDYWREMLSRTHAPMDLTTEHADAFHAYQRNLRLGAVTVWGATFNPVVFQRTPRLIRQSDPEGFLVSVLLQMDAAVADWGDRHAVYAPYDIHIQNTSRTMTIDGRAASGVVRVLCADIPKDLLPLPRDRADQMVGLPVSGRSGIGALLTVFLRQMLDGTGPYRPSDGPRLGATVVDLVSALFAHTLEVEGDLPPETRARTLTMRIRSFIARNLHDPDLSPAVIAAAHHISLSYLHRLFQADGVSVGALIREQRLERARRDLADPTLRDVPVHDIAVRSGFAHHSAFTRAFRAAYGMPPIEYRRQACHDRMGRGHG